MVEWFVGWTADQEILTSPRIHCGFTSESKEVFKKKTSGFIVPVLGIINLYMSQCMTKGGLWHDVILVRKEHYDVIADYVSFSTKPGLYKQWKINVSDEEYDI